MEHWSVYGDLINKIQFLISYHGGYLALTYKLIKSLLVLISL